MTKRACVVVQKSMLNTLRLALYATDKVRYEFLTKIIIIKQRDFKQARIDFYGAVTSYRFIAGNCNELPSF